jgi:polysaccharide pyruvyl transferase WcaK-like protein
LEHPQLRAKARAILPAVNLITLREQRSGVSLLQTLGVSNARMTVTGDDAIELAYGARREELGQGIGINLRVANYAKIDPDIVDMVKSTVQVLAQQLGAPLLPIPIDQATYEGKIDSDCASIRKLLAGFDDASDGGKDLKTPLSVINQVGKCRVVVTGSYHAGVFALSQGIPIVGLAKSQYYAGKFLGLAGQFKSGCQVILLDSRSSQQQLADAIKTAWSATEEIRPTLLLQAQKQIQMGQQAYQQLPKLI